jgi:hypothetical protein
MRNLYYLTYLLWLVLGLGTHAALAQTQRVTGKVTTADGKEELPGVTVLLKGTNNGTGTGPDGTYSLQVPAAGGTLIFSYVGYTTQEVPITGQTTINVSLKGEAKGLDEVVVVGYGSQKKSDVTGAARPRGGGRRGRGKLPARRSALHPHSGQPLHTRLQRAAVRGRWHSAGPRHWFK